MSKEATGKNGAVLGSSEYWYYVNHATIFDRVMRNTSDINYRETLSEVGNRAGSAVEEIYDDLQDHIKYVSAIPPDNRSALATQVEALYNVCNMAGGFCSHSSECIGILNLSSFYLPSSSFRDERAIQDAIRKIENCSDFFTSCWIDVLQSNRTGIEIGRTTSGAEDGLNNAFVYNNHPYIRFDPPHNGRQGWYRGTKQTIDYNHVNFDKMPNSNRLYDWIQHRYNYYPLSDDAYYLLKDLKTTGKKVRIAGKVLLVAGTALEALELGMTIHEDLKDADEKLGRATASTAASIGGSWAGGALGAKAGALLGTLTGPAAPIAIPILSVVGGIAGSFGGDAFGRWVGDITDLGN